MTAKPISEVTEAEFLAYRRVQESGRYNMLFDSAKAMKSAHMRAPTYWAIIGNYPYLYNKFIKKDCQTSL